MTKSSGYAGARTCDVAHDAGALRQLIHINLIKFVTLFYYYGVEL